MRFDDTLSTAIATSRTGAAGALAAWRQIVDLVGRGRVPADDRTIAALDQLRQRVPADVRAASARALFGADPPAALVALLARDEVAVSAPVLRSATLSPAEWRAILPTLPPAGRAVLRHRRDLPASTVRALASFGAVDFVIGDEGVAPAHAAPADAPAPATPAASPPEPGPFLSVGQIAAGIVDRAMRRDPLAEGPPPPQARPDGTFRIADVVARIEAFRRRQDGEGPLAAPAGAVAQGFRFETDADGVVRWIDGVAREALVGISIATAAAPGCAGVDGVAAGAFAKRARFDAARMLVAGTGDGAGDWTIAGVPAFDRASGRFTGYRGAARRPRAGERAAPAGPGADALRQLVHELRTPTNAIAGFSEMIEHEMLGPVAGVYRDQARAIRRDSGALLAAIDDLDTAARIAARALPLRPEPVALAPLAARIAERLAPLAEDRGAGLAVTGEGAATADAIALERLIDRLVATAAAAASAGETIAIRIAEDDAARVEIAVDRPQALVRHAGEALFAIDDGDASASLLGTGFALRLVRNLARELGGTFIAGDRRLTVRLPAAVDRPAGQAREG